GQLDAAWLRVLDAELNTGRVELWEARHAAARALGATSYRLLFEGVLGVDMDAYAAQAERLLRDSEALFEPSFDRLLRAHAGVGLAGARASDVPRVMRADDLDARFPEAAARVVLDETLRGLGIHPERQTNIVFDTESRPTKDPRAFCSPVRVPGEVYLVISPTGGLDDYRALFHEAGHAQHFGGMASGLPFEFRHLGDNAVTEAFAFLFEGLVHDPTWLGAMLGGRDHAAVTSHAGTTRLYYQRRYCAKFAYERAFHRDGPTGMASRYADVLTDATRVEWPEERFVTDIDDGFYVVAYLRAWALECGLRRHLVERFGRRWFASRAAGSLLRELWEDGQRLNAEEFASELGLPRLDLAILTEDAAELVG
ncbi:MAG: hypothetical protein HYX33_03535, partial [Actinobacteria bacterium]|nr:hypothetical protein [Actinomycetota bacterium]